MAARDNISNNQFHMHLYHGTTSKYTEGIKAAGLGAHRDGSNVFLTHDRGLAAYYADTAADQEGGKPAIVKVRVNPRNLVVDHNSFEDPVLAPEWGARQRSFDESQLRNSGTDWKNSLKQTGSALHLGNIPPENVLEVKRSRVRVNNWD